MSTEATFEDFNEYKAANVFLRGDGDNRERKGWLLVEHSDNNPLLLKLLTTSDKNGDELENFVDHLRDDQVMYGLIRLTSSHDMSTTVKFVYIRWIGPKVPFSKLGRFGVVHGSISKKFEQYHCFIETSQREDLTEKELLSKLEDNAGTTNHVLDGPIGSRQERGFTAMQTKGEKKRQEPSRIAPEPLPIDVDKSVYDAINRVHSDQEATNWCIASFENRDVSKRLILGGEGTGNFSEVSQHFDDEQVMFALYRIKDMIDGIQTVKFAFVYWLGDKVKPMQKAKISAYCKPIERIFRAHVGLTMSSKNEAIESIIIEKVTASSGSKMWVK